MFKPRTRILAWLVSAILFSVFACSNSWAAANPETVARDAAKSLGAQIELPEDPVSKPIDPSSSGSRFRIPEGLASFILWGAVIAAVLVILWTMRDNILQLFRRPVALEAQSQPQASLPPISVERLQGAQLEADELASQGRFVEAMHVLLLRGLAELRRSFRLRFADSLTSRELLGLLPLPATTLGALTDIVERVELAYFGERAVVASDYQACRESFDVLTATARGQAQGRAHG